MRGHAASRPLRLRPGAGRQCGAERWPRARGAPRRRGRPRRHRPRADDRWRRPPPDPVAADGPTAHARRARPRPGAPPAATSSDPRGRAPRAASDRTRSTRTGPVLVGHAPRAGAGRRADGRPAFTPARRARPRRARAGPRSLDRDPASVPAARAPPLRPGHRPTGRARAGTAARRRGRGAPALGRPARSCAAGRRRHLGGSTTLATPGHPRRRARVGVRRRLRAVDCAGGRAAAAGPGRTPRPRPPGRPTAPAPRDRHRRGARSRPFGSPVARAPGLPAPRSGRRGARGRAARRLRRDRLGGGDRAILVGLGLAQVAAAPARPKRHAPGGLVQRGSRRARCGTRRRAAGRWAARRRRCPGRTSWPRAGRRPGVGALAGTARAPRARWYPGPRRRRGGSGRRPAGMVRCSDRGVDRRERSRGRRRRWCRRRCRRGDGDRREHALGQRGGPGARSTRRSRGRWAHRHSCRRRARRAAGRARRGRRRFTPRRSARAAVGFGRRLARRHRGCELCRSVRPRPGDRRTARPGGRHDRVR